LDEENIRVDFAPSHQSALYAFSFEKDNFNRLIISTSNGQLGKNEKGVSGYQIIGGNGTTVYAYFETEQTPLSVEQLAQETGRNETYVLTFNAKEIKMRYGISFISREQAEKNLRREINTYSVDEIAKVGREKWNEVLGKIEVKGADDNQKAVFYTSLYRTYERMIMVSEDGKYYSAADQQVHSDEGQPYYTDDWIWDTYRAVHPLRVLIEADREIDMIQSYIRMAQQSPEGWMPVFPGIAGDAHVMNCNHGVAMVWDAYCKGLRGFDLAAAYEACKGALTKKSLLPWRKVPNTELDVFYHEKGYFPALKPE
jgi:predicted alpha-1,2-mannosidase